MEQLFEGKRVPWSQMEEYLNIYNNKILPYVTLKNSGGINIQLAETFLPRPLFELHELITKILRDINILPSEEESKLNQLKLCIDTVK